MTIRSIYALVREEIIAVAREQAEAVEQMSHGYEVGSAQAIAYEHAYLERKLEMEAVDV